MKEIFNLYFFNPSIFFLNKIYSLVFDAGISIILFTLSLKIFLLPLSYYLYLEEEKTKKINKLILESTKNVKDIVKKSEIISEIYKKEKFNPFKIFFLQLIFLPIFIGVFLAINSFLKYTHGYFLNIIELQKPNVFFGFFVLILQIVYLYFSNNENKKISLILIIAISPVFFVLSSGLLLYVLVSILLTLLERKVFSWYKIKFAIGSVSENNSQRSN
jgi:membrane protein insertase Oxa1/YidC/SpoIIIJ